MSFLQPKTGGRGGVYIDKLTESRKFQRNQYNNNNNTKYHVWFFFFYQINNLLSNV